MKINQAVILAGGFGKRLRIAIKDVPKPMAPIFGKPFLEHKINLLKKQGIKNIILCVHYMADKIKNHFGNGEKFGVNISYSEEEIPLGTGGALKKVENQIQETFLVLNGDTYTKMDFQKFFNFHKLRNSKYTLGLINSEKTHSGGNVKLEGDKILYFNEEGEKTGLINSGVYLLEPEIFKEIPGNKKISLEAEIFPKLTREKEVYGYKTDDYFVDIGIPETYYKFIEDIYLGKIKTTETIFRGKTPLRVTFAGGGTDMNYIFEKYGGITINSTINKYCHATIKKREDNLVTVNGEKPNELLKGIIDFLKPDFGFDLYHYSDLPPGRGLGSSASFIALIVSLINELQNIKYDDYKLIEVAYRIEREKLNIEGGWQDQYSVVIGGFNFIEFQEDKKIVYPLKLKEDVIKELEEYLLLVYVGKSHDSSEMQKEHRKNKDTSIESLMELKRLAIEIKECLLNSKIENIGELLKNSWEHKKNTNHLASNQTIDRLYEIGLKNGATGGKLIGAGDGGYILFFCPPEKKYNLIENVGKEGEVLNFNFCSEGIKIWGVK